MEGMGFWLVSILCVRQLKALVWWYSHTQNLWLLDLWLMVIGHGSHNPGERCIAFSFQILWSTSQTNEMKNYTIALDYLVINALKKPSYITFSSYTSLSMAWLSVKLSIQMQILFLQTKTKLLFIPSVQLVQWSGSWESARGHVCLQEPVHLDWSWG